jgi:hypothetical protein
VSQTRHAFFNNFKDWSAWHDVVMNATTCNGPGGPVVTGTQAFDDQLAHSTPGVVARWTTSCRPKFLAKLLEKGCRKRDTGFHFEEACAGRLFSSRRSPEESDGGVWLVFAESFSSA